MCKLNGKTKFHVLNVPVISPPTVSYIHSLIINSISISYEDSINARQLQHESLMLDVYNKMTPDSFKTQLQAVLTAYYEDIKGIQGAACCSIMPPCPSLWSADSKTPKTPNRRPRTAPPCRHRDWTSESPPRRQQ
jgi:hypothetical protein